MRAADVGAMRERVQIYEQSQTVDAAGSIATTWTLAATTWARVEPLGASAIVLAGRDDAQRLYRMTIRYRTDISTNSQIVWRARKFDVEGILDPTEQRVFLNVTMREINA